MKSNVLYFLLVLFGALYSMQPPSWPIIAADSNRKWDLPAPLVKECKLLNGIRSFFNEHHTAHQLTPEEIILPLSISTHGFEKFLQYLNRLNPEKKDAATLSALLQQESNENLRLIVTAADFFNVPSLLNQSLNVLTDRLDTLDSHTITLQKRVLPVALPPPLEATIVERMIGRNPLLYSVLLKEQEMNQSLCEHPKTPCSTWQCVPFRGSIVHPQKNLFLTLNKNYAWILFNTKGKQLHQYRYHWNTPACASLDSSGTYLACGNHDKKLRWWNLASPKEADSYKEMTRHAHSIQNLTFSLDGKKLISLDSTHTLIVTDTKTGTVLLEWPHAPAPSFLDSPHIILPVLYDTYAAFYAISAHAIYLFNTLNLTIQLIPLPNWQLTTLAMDKKARPICGFHNGLLFMSPYSTAREATHEQVTCIASAGDDSILTIAAGHKDGLITVWTPEECPPNLFYLNAHAKRIDALTLNKKRDLLVSASVDKLIRIWSLALKTCLHELSGHSNSLRTVSFADDETSLISTDYDCNLKLWYLINPESKKFLKQLSAAQYACLITIARASLHKEEPQIPLDSLAPLYYSLPERLKSYMYHHLSLRQQLHLAAASLQEKVTTFFKTHEF